MGNFLALIFLGVFGVLGLYYYTQSGEVLNEAPPAVVETKPAEEKKADETLQKPEEKKPEDTTLKNSEIMKKQFPDEPKTEDLLGPQTAQELDTMLKNAKEKEMTPEEKKAMEEKMTAMMNPAPSEPATSPETSSPTTPPASTSSPQPEVTSEASSESSVTGFSRSGTFTTIDVIHKGSGKALIYPETADGPLLRLQDFNVTRGPDLYVYLSKNTDIKEAAQLGEFMSVGTLKSSKGNQNYKLPENHADYKSVVIWCQAFGVLFTSATLQP